jgi:hypothetical protein
METFVVRIWAPADAADRDPTKTDVHGRVEHVPSGRRATFHGTEELGALIVRQLEKPGHGAGPAREQEG